MQLPARQRAIRAAAEIWAAVDTVSEELSAEIGSAPRFGIGCIAEFRWSGLLAPETATIRFLGDSGNVAARLEGLTKEMDCVAILSAATVDAAGAWRPSWQLDVRSRDQQLPVFMRHRLDEIRCEPLEIGSSPLLHLVSFRTPAVVAARPLMVVQGGSAPTAANEEMKPRRSCM